MDTRLPGYLRSFGIDMFLDVGANAGQFARELLAADYQGRIVSFEPLTKAHNSLLEAARGHERWTIEQRCALGEAQGTAIINVAGNLESSSLLPMLEAHSQAAPASRYVDTETVPVRTLDDVAYWHVAGARAAFLKLDVQGYEERVLRGASRTLPRIQGAQLEMSLVPLYEGEMVFESWLARMRLLGFELWWIRPGFTDKRTGRVLQVDGIFFRIAAEPSPDRGRPSE